MPDTTPLSQIIRDTVACPTCSSSVQVPCTEAGSHRIVNWVHLERINYYARQQRQSQLPGFSLPDNTPPANLERVYFTAEAAAAASRTATI